MAFKTVFKRYELKYMLTYEQKQKILQAMSSHMKQDAYGKSTIVNLYFDTDTYLLIRRSIEKPKYKEKIRIRSYGRAKPDSTVFVELKKKYNHIVYKRRISLSESEATKWLQSGKQNCYQSQISEEIDYFIKYYKTLHPTMWLSYEREAFFANDGSDFRITFDDTVLCRDTDLSLNSNIYGVPILPEGKVLMELKVCGGIPLWMTETLSKEKIYKTSFSKYGTAYQTIIFPQLQSGRKQTLGGNKNV